MDERPQKSNPPPPPPKRPPIPPGFIVSDEPEILPTPKLKRVFWDNEEKLWYRNDVSDDEIGEGVGLPEAKSLGDLKRRTADDPNELLRTGYLCRGGGLLLAAPTGIGKSAFSIQAQIMFALGRPMFEIQPARPLRSLYVQAENDDGDLAEMRDGVIAGLALSPKELKAVYSSIVTVHENTRTLRPFFDNTVAPLLELHRPDLLWIDPALAYIGGESNSQKDVGVFLRNLLNPLLSQFNCGGVVIHHTNKPSKGEEKKEWQAGDFAYSRSVTGTRMPHRNAFGHARWGVLPAQSVVTSFAFRDGQQPKPQICCFGFLVVF
jgi:hypothetical protein